MLNSSNSILALDVGGKRIGVAIANIVARIAHPMTALENNDAFVTNLQKLVAEHEVAVLVVGLPRGLNGQYTAQTTTVEAFIETIKEHIQLPIHWQDEAVTSQKAEAELNKRGLPFKKGDIDALAATYILEDFLNDHPEIRA